MVEMTSKQINTNKTKQNKIIKSGTFELNDVIVS